MKIYLGVASPTYRENSKYYNKILETVAELGHDDVQTKNDFAGGQSGLKGSFMCLLQPRLKHGVFGQQEGLGGVVAGVLEGGKG